MPERRRAGGRRAIVLLGCAFAVTVGCEGEAGRAARAGEGGRPALLVSAAASLSEAIAEVAERYEDEQDVRILLNVAGSQMLAAQIIEGAPVDVFISADVLQMDRATAAGRIDPARRIDLLSNQLVVVVPSDRPGTVAGPHDLANASVARIAVGDPEAVPAGVYARRYLESEGLWDSLAPRIVPASSVRAALRAVEAGTVDAGIVYRTDAASSGSTEVAYAVPPEAGPAIVYPAAVVRDAPDPVRAARFLEHLQSGAARRRFEAAGFIALPRAAERGS